MKFPLEYQHPSVTQDYAARWAGLTPTLAECEAFLSVLVAA